MFAIIPTKIIGIYGERMIISTKGRYAIRIMTALAKSDGYSSLKEVAERENIPHKYAENIMTALVKAGLVDGVRGKSGGYKLAFAPEEITAADILRVTETSLSAVVCTSTETNPCPRASICPTLPMWKELDAAVNGVLTGYTLAGLISKK